MGNERLESTLANKENTMDYKAISETDSSTLRDYLVNDFSYSGHPIDDINSKLSNKEDIDGIERMLLSAISNMVAFRVFKSGELTHGRQAKAYEEFIENTLKRIEESKEYELSDGLKVNIGYLNTIFDNARKINGNEKLRDDYRV